jgi:hypothetical protein
MEPGVRHPQFRLHQGRLAWFHLAVGQLRLTSTGERDNTVATNQNAGGLGASQLSMAEFSGGRSPLSAAAVSNAAVSFALSCANAIPSSNVRILPSQFCLLHKLSEVGLGRPGRESNLDRRLSVRISRRAGVTENHSWWF